MLSAPQLYGREALLLGPTSKPNNLNKLRSECRERGQTGCEAEGGSDVKYPCRSPEEIYELYDAVEATEDSSLSPRGRGL